MTKKEIKELWGETLYNAFKEHLTDDGWLTINWAHILEEKFNDWDDDYNDTNIKSRLYQQMYLLDFDDNFNGSFIKPTR